MWYDFATKRKIDTNTASVSDIAEFFAIHFSTGTSSYNQITKLRASISTLFEHRPEILSQSPIIQRLFRAFFNINPPQTRQTFQWNPDDLLELLRTDKYNEELTLQTLGTKTAALILLATACRKYELKSIDLNHMTFHQDLIQIKLVTLPKNFTKDRPDPEICELKILANPHDQQLCPVFHIKKYMECTQNIRNTTRLFITSTPPFTAISKDRLGKWVKTLLKEMPTHLQPGQSFQSPRSAVSSALFNKGVPLDTILAHCRWSTSSVFFKYYYKRNPTQPEAAYRKVMYNKKPKATHTNFRKPLPPVSLINLSEKDETQPSTSTNQEITNTLQTEQVSPEVAASDNTCHPEQPSDYQPPTVTPPCQVVWIRRPAMKNKRLTLVLDSTQELPDIEYIKSKRKNPTKLLTAHLCPIPTVEQAPLQFAPIHQSTTQWQNQKFLPKTQASYFCKANKSVQCSTRTNHYLNWPQFHPIIEGFAIDVRTLPEWFTSEQIPTAATLDVQTTIPPATPHQNFSQELTLLPNDFEIDVSSEILEEYNIECTVSPDNSDHKYEIKEKDKSSRFLIDTLHYPFNCFIRHASNITPCHDMWIPPSRQPSVPLNNLNINLLRQAADLHANRYALISDIVNNSIFITFAYADVPGFEFLTSYNNFVLNNSINNVQQM